MQKVKEHSLRKNHSTTYNLCHFVSSSSPLPSDTWEHFSAPQFSDHFDHTFDSAGDCSSHEDLVLWDIQHLSHRNGRVLAESHVEVAACCSWGRRTDQRRLHHKHSVEDDLGEEKIFEIANSTKLRAKLTATVLPRRWTVDLSSTEIKVPHKQANREDSTSKNWCVDLI